MVSNLPLFTGTVTANGQGNTFDLGDLGQLSIVSYLDITAASGTTPTLNVIVQDSPDGTIWDTLLTHTQQTGAAINTQRTNGAIGRYIRVSYTVGGTTPSFTFTVSALMRG